MTLPRDLWCEDLEWWFQERDSQCGHRSVLAAQISALERGGAPGSPNSDPYTDGQLGWGDCINGAFERDRRVYRAWQRLSFENQVILAAYYEPRLQLRVKRKTEMEITNPPGLGSVAALLVPEVLRGTLKASKLQQEAEKRVKSAHKAYYEAQSEEMRAWADGSG